MMFKKLSFCTTILILALSLAGQTFAQHDWTDQIATLKAVVVNIETAHEIVFEIEEPGVSCATGFIVDARRGIIATNAHVTGISPAYIKVNFYNGSFTEARTLYYDPVHDFGFLKIDPDKLRFELKEAKLGSRSELGVGDDVLLIGNNEAEEYSIKFGSVANLNVNKGDQYSSYVHTTFDRAGGSSGSPVWNTKDEVIGIHARGNETSSFELPVDYMKDALELIQRGEEIKRGYIGADLDLISVGEAVRHFGVPEAVQDQVPLTDNGVPKLIQVESIITGASADGLLKPGDILYRINGTLLNEDLYRLDRILNGHVGTEVRFEIYRNGALEPLEVPVDDLEKTKIKRFAHFGGAVFHDITPRLRWFTGYTGSGVFLPYSSEGSSFSQLGYHDDETDSMKIVITEVNGRRVDNLNDFVEVCKGIDDGTHTYVLRRDLSVYQQSVNPISVSLNLKYGPLKVFSWNADTLEWEKEVL